MRLLEILILLSNTPLVNSPSDHAEAIPMHTATPETHSEGSTNESVRGSPAGLGDLTDCYV
jgi:hypothetical protein